MNIILIGMMGSGKSTVAKKLSKELCMEVLDTDTLIEKNEKMSIKDIFEKQGEHYFRKLEEKLFFEIASSENSIISTGGGAVLNDTLRPLDNQKIIYLKWSVGGLISNLTSKVDNRPLLEDESLEKKLSDIYTKRKFLYENWANYTIECDNKSVNEVVNEIIKFI